MMTSSLPILEHTRGGLVEAVHCGSIAVVDSTGTLLYSHGDPHTVAFLRSSAKPFQALPFVEAGGVEFYAYSPAELALACASHETAQIHLDTVQEMQKKIGIQECDLQCGPHLPSDPAKFREVITLGIQPTANFNNCSGKHTTMLGFAKMLGTPLATYLEFDHPAQREILKTFSEMCMLEQDQVVLGVDGCSAPNFAVPLYHAALGMARLSDPKALTSRRAAACKKIFSAMTTHPAMVSNHGEFDCELMKAGEGRILTKRGAEGFQIIGLLPGILSESGIGIAFKVTDGDKSSMNNSLQTSARVRPAVVLEILRQLKVLNETQLQTLAGFGPIKTLKNYAGLITGTSQPVFRIV